MGYVLGWLLLSFIMAFLAKSKGRSGFAWFFISILISPLIAVIILLVIGDSEEKKDADLNQVLDAVGDRMEISAKTEQEKAIESLQKYKSLLELGAISQEEFDNKKAELMPILRHDI